VGSTTSSATVSLSARVLFPISVSVELSPKRVGLLLSLLLNAFGKCHDPGFRLSGIGIKKLEKEGTVNPIVSSGS
jgi:hypothetical protein